MNAYPACLEDGLEIRCSIRLSYGRDLGGVDDNFRILRFLIRIGDPSKFLEDSSTGFRV